VNFQEAESYLLSLGNEVETMKLGLDNTRKLLSALGDPQTKYLKVQVAGTNGKGSVCAFLDAICGAAEVKRGIFTSPHLVSVTERIRINGSDISEEDFARNATVVRETAERMLADGQLDHTPTFFEQITAIALLAFAQANVDLAILETGLGGRLDATTAANAEIAAITRIDLDHQEYLGDTIEEIAAEKAAIIRPDTQAIVVGEQSPAALAVINERIKNTGVTARRISASDTPPPEQTELGLQGAHQLENAQIAIALAETLRQYFEITQDQITAGLENARHPGRLEFQDRYLFEGAHNPGGARALREFIDAFVDRPITLIFGAMKGKDVAQFAETVFPTAEHIVLTRINSPRSMTAREIADQITRNGSDIQLTANVADALKKAHQITPSDAIILVTGSLYLVGEVKQLLRSQI
jgi:dihydrofolate synthase/folylpolyglutamate synthase